MAKIYTSGMPGSLSDLRSLFCSSEMVGPYNTRPSQAKPTLESLSLEQNISFAIKKFWELNSSCFFLTENFNRTLWRELLKNLKFNHTWHEWPLTVILLGVNMMIFWWARTITFEHLRARLHWHVHLKTYQNENWTMDRSGLQQLWQHYDSSRFEFKGSHLILVDMTSTDTKLHSNV